MLKIILEMHYNYGATQSIFYEATRIIDKHICLTVAWSQEIYHVDLCFTQT